LQMWANSDQAQDLRFGQEAKARSIELKLPGTGLRSTPRIETGEGKESPTSSAVTSSATGNDNNTQIERWHGNSSVEVTPIDDYMHPHPHPRDLRTTSSSSFELVRQSKPPPLQDIVERPEAAMILGKNALPQVIPSIATILQSSQMGKPSGSGGEPTRSTTPGLWRSHSPYSG